MSTINIGTDFNPEFHRDLYLSGVVDYLSVDELIQKINKINEFDHEVEQQHFEVLTDNIRYVKLPEEQEIEFLPPDHKPIRLSINSEGGDAQAMIALINTISNSGTPIVTEAIGQCKSAGLAIFMAGHHRIAYKNSQFMYHEVQTSDMGSLTSIKRNNEYRDKIQAIYDNYITEWSNINQEELEEYKSVDGCWEFDGEEAFILGVVDELIDANQECNCTDCTCDKEFELPDGVDMIDGNGVEYEAE